MERIQNNSDEIGVEEKIQKLEFLCEHFTPDLSLKTLENIKIESEQEIQVLKYLEELGLDPRDQDFKTTNKILALLTSLQDQRRREKQGIINHKPSQ